jgi:predicted enzyme related to lactoylglutathione lyase
MAGGTNRRARRPAWIDLASANAPASREFYGKLLGWQVEVSDDPQYGGYGIAHLADGGEDVAGIGPKMSEEAPTAWNLYIGTDDVDALAASVQAAGGMVIAPAFDVGDMGRMAVFADPSGAVLSAWQPAGEGSFRAGEVGTFGWAELNARGFEKARDFYAQVFGWTTTTTPMGEGQPDYHQFAADGENILGGMEMSPVVPAEMPSYWMLYFNVADVDASFRQALALGATEMVAPTPMPGGRFAIVSDPQGAMFGLLKMDQG